jgi:NADPH:quinone reductase-like Zn-dependent oxidoreductase
MSGPYLAAAIDQFGDADQVRLRELPQPQAGRGEIVVRVEAASVNPIDTRRRAGYGRRLFSLMGAARMPLVLGNDFAGTVCAVGRDVTAFREGDAVFGAKPPSSQGSHATHVVVDARLALRQPPGLTAGHLAALPYNFLTVSRALAGAGITRDTIDGRRVLVHGASGGLGLIALRLLHGMGARVTAVAGGAHGQACLQAGAESVVNRHAIPLRALPREYVATLNFASWEDDATMLRLHAPGSLGHATTVHPLLGQLDHHGLIRGLAASWLTKRSMSAQMPRGARYAWTVFRPAPAALASLAECAPLLSLPLALVSYPLAQAAQAHRHVEQRQAGRAILLPHLIT